MQGSAVRFYADAQDMSDLLSSFGRSGPFVYTSTLSDTGAPLTSVVDPGALMGYLRTHHPQANNVFLITPEGVEINSRALTMRDGSGIKMKADQPANPRAVLINLGGQMERILIATSINTTNETPMAKATFKQLKKLVLENAKYIEGFYVLPGALTKFMGGWRLTPDPGFAKSEDLILPGQ